MKESKMERPFRAFIRSMEELLNKMKEVATKAGIRPKNYIEESETWHDFNYEDAKQGSSFTLRMLEEDSRGRKIVPTPILEAGEVKIPFSQLRAAMDGFEERKPGHEIH